MAVCLSWAALAHADDALNRNVHFDIRSASRGEALVEFAAQSGVQVAVADADVAPLQFDGLIGDYSAPPEARLPAA
jgi:hypothetical protein